MLRRSMSKIMKAIFFSDVDGTLLDDNYSYEKALSGINLLKERGIPLCLISSKTFDEMTELCGELDLYFPFGFENGAGIAYPQRDGFSFELFSDITDLMDEVIPLIERFSGEKIFPLKTLSVSEIARLTGLSSKRASLAKERKTSVPFVTSCGGKLPHDVFDEINLLLASYDLVITSGARFNHILKKGIDKGFAVKKIEEFYCNCVEFPLTAAAGDSHNDVPMLLAVKKAYVVRRSDGTYMDTYKNFIFTEQIGPWGFSEAVRDFMSLINFY